MEKSEIEKALIKIVSDLQILSGREEVAVTEDTTPLEDLPDFDSLNGVEATVDVLEQLGLDVDFNNVFVKDGEALTIREAAVRLFERQSAKPTA